MRLLGLVLTVVLFPGPAYADFLEVRRPATLKAAPNSDAEIRKRYDDGDLLDLLDGGAQTNRYYHAREVGGPQGFIFRTLVRRHAGPILGAEPDVGEVEPGSGDRITSIRVATVAEIPTGSPPEGVFRIHLIDVGTGLAILIQGHDFTMLYDGGSADDKRGFSGSDNQSRLLAYLYAAIGPSGPGKCVPKGDSFTSSGGTQLTIDHMVLSHPHDDHGSMLDEVLACYEVTNVWDSGRVNEAVFYESFLKAVAAEGGTYRTVTSPPANRSVTVKSTTPVVFPPSVTWQTFKENDHQHLGDRAFFDVLHADGAKHSDPNENSIVLRVQLGDTSILLTGDAESGPRADPSADVGDIEAHLRDHHKNAIDVDILQLGHHGSKTSNRTSFLKDVSPEWVLIGSGPKKFKTVILPDQEVIDALLTVMAPLGTDRILSTNLHDRPRNDADAPHLCPEADKVGTNEPKQPGGCDNYVLTIDTR